MAKVLKKQAVTWIVDSENEAISMIEDYKSRQNDELFTVAKSGYKAKVKKSKGEIIDTTYQVEIVQNYQI